MKSSEKSKHNKKALKKEQKKERQKNQRNKEIKKKKVTTSIKYLLAAAGLILVIFLIKSSYDVEPGDPKITFTQKTINLGDVSVLGGPVSTKFGIKNDGGGILTISDMETSCACTSASVIYEGIEGPMFNMRAHGTNPTDWSVKIKPGDTADLKIIYDPRVHLDHRGPTTRVITVFSDDLLNPAQEVYIKLNQVD
ncbi:MAG: DUF1573 domain-containing protein [Candidatus Hydrothermarchaeaceae archaeon]